MHRIYKAVGIKFSVIIIDAINSAGELTSEEFFEKQ